MNKTTNYIKSLGTQEGGIINAKVNFLPNLKIYLHIKINYESHILRALKFITKQFQL